MLEIPETYAFAGQANELLSGRRVVKVYDRTNIHKFTWFSDPIEKYRKGLIGRTFTEAGGHGMFIDLKFSDKACLTVYDGVSMRLLDSWEELPKSYQMALELDDSQCLVFTVAMYGGIWLHKGNWNNTYYVGSMNTPSPLEDSFTEGHLEKFIKKAPANLSMKGFLATDQRIPGLGNGCLQDILFNARLNPRKRTVKLKDAEKTALYQSVVSTLRQMAGDGGRDTEKDLRGNPGGYKSILSRYTCKRPCPVCGRTIKKETYMGGTVYYCPGCQPV